MPTDTLELSSRLALCTPEDRVRGMMINEVLKLVEQKAGADARAEAAKVLPEGVRHRDLISYPISDFMRLMYRSADLLEKTYGGHAEALQACGGARQSTRSPGRPLEECCSAWSRWRGRRRS